MNGKADNRERKLRAREDSRPSRSEVSGLRSEVAGGRPDEFLTKQELAARLKVTVRTVENWQQDGILPHLKISNVIRFYWPDVIEHLRANFSVGDSGVVRTRWGARKEAGNAERGAGNNEVRGQQAEVNQTAKNRHLTPGAVDEVSAPHLNRPAATFSPERRRTVSPIEAERESKRRGGAR